MTEKLKVNYMAGLVDIVIILSSLYLFTKGLENWWWLLILLAITGSYKMEAK